MMFPMNRILSGKELHELAYGPTGKPKKSEMKKDKDGILVAQNASKQPPSAPGPAEASQRKASALSAQTQHHHPSKQQQNQVSQRSIQGAKPSTQGPRQIAAGNSRQPPPATSCTSSVYWSYQQLEVSLGQLQDNLSPEQLASMDAGALDEALAKLRSAHLVVTKLTGSVDAALQQRPLIKQEPSSKTLQQDPKGKGTVHSKQQQSQHTLQSQSQQQQQVAKQQHQDEQLQRKRLLQPPPRLDPINQQQQKQPQKQLAPPAKLHQPASGYRGYISDDSSDDEEDEEEEELVPPSHSHRQGSSSGPISFGPGPLHAAAAPPAPPPAAGRPSALPGSSAGGSTSPVMCQVCRIQVPQNGLGQFNKSIRVCRPCLTAAAHNPKKAVLPHCPRVNCHEQNVRLTPAGYHSSGSSVQDHWIEFKNGEFVSHRPKPMRKLAKRPAGGGAGGGGKGGGGKKLRVGGLL